MMRYTRIYADARGQSHFEDVMVPVTRRRSPTSTGISDYSSPFPARSAVIRRVVVAHPDEPHTAPDRRIAIQLSGQMEVEVGDGEVRRFGPGDIVLLEDTTGTGHITREVGAEERTTMFVELDEELEGRR